MLLIKYLLSRNQKVQECDATMLKQEQKFANKNKNALLPYLVIGKTKKPPNPKDRWLLKAVNNFILI